MDGVVLAVVVAMSVLFIVTSVLMYLQLRQIHAAVNSSMTRALEEISALNKQVTALTIEGEVRG